MVPARDLKTIIIFGRFDAGWAGFGRVPDYKIKIIDFFLIYALYPFCFGMSIIAVDVFQICFCFVAIW